MKGLSLTAALSALAVVAFVIPGSAPASYAAPAQRLVVMTESVFGREVVLMDEWGRERAGLVVFPGLNGGIAVSRQGTRFAYVQAVGFDVPLDLPPRLRQRFARLPQSTLRFGSFLQDVLVPGLNSFSVSLTASPLIAAAPGRPAWSPNGTRVAFAQARSGHVHLFAARVDSTSEPRQLTRSPGRDLNPRWSPDGRVIVFERHVAGEADLYAVRPDGTAVRRLTYWRGTRTNARLLARGPLARLLEQPDREISAVRHADPRELSEEAHVRLRRRPATDVVTGWTLDRLLERP